MDNHFACFLAMIEAHSGYRRLMWIIVIPKSQADLHELIVAKRPFLVSKGCGRSPSPREALPCIQV